MSGVEGAYNAPEIKTAAPESAEIAEQKANPDVLAAAGKNAVSGVMGALDKLANANKPAASAERTPDQAEQKEKSEDPSPAEVLDVIVGLHKAIIQRMHEDAKSTTPRTRGLDSRMNMWNTFERCLNDFRTGIGLPHVKDANYQIQKEIDSALQTENSALLLRIFNKELREAAKPKKPWYKRIPGLNFVAGAGAGAVELGGGVATFVNEGRKALGVGATAEEQKQAKEILAHVGNSLKDLSAIGAALIRSQEYADSIQKDAGETTGYVMGKTYFDIAAALLGEHALKAGAKAIKMSTSAGKMTAAIAAETVTGTGGEISKNVAKVMAAETAREIEKGVAKRLTRAVKNVAGEAKNEAAKESAKMTGHEVEHRDHIATAEDHEENPEREHG